MFSFLKKPWVVTLGIALGAVALYSFIKSKNPGGYFSWLP